MNDYGRIEQSALLRDIDSVVSKDKGLPKWIYITATIHTVKEDVPVIKVMYRANANKYFTDTLGFGEILLMIGTGDFFYRVYPYRDNLEISIKRQYLYENGTDDPRLTQVYRYKAIYDTERNPSPQMDNDANRNIEDLNRMGQIELTFTLLELFAEAYRITTVDGAYTNKTTQQLLESTIPYRLNKTKAGNRPIVEAIHVDPPDNQSPYRNLIIPAGMLARNLPGWLQECGNGVYVNGIGNFIARYKNRYTFFTYPLFDYKRFNKDVEKLVIYFAPQDRYSGIDTTYRVEGKVLYVVTTSTPPAIDNASNNDMNTGIGYRFTSPTGLMTKPADLTDGVKAKFRELNTEIINRARPDQLNYSRVVGSLKNQYFEASKILKNQQTQISITWEYGVAELIYPGMPCKCMFMNQGVYEEKLGTVATMMDVERLQGNPMTSTRYSMGLELTLSIEPLNFKPTVPTDSMVYGDTAI